MALVRRTFRQLCLGLTRLTQKANAQIKVCLHSLKFLLLLFLLFKLLLSRSALFCKDVLEICIYLCLFATPYSHLRQLVRRLLVIRRRQRHHGHAVHAGPQTANAVFSVLVSLRFLFYGLVAYGFDPHLAPRFPLYIQNPARNPSPLCACLPPTPP